MVFKVNQDKNETYIFKEMFSQPDKSVFIMSMFKKVEYHETKNHWMLTKKTKFNNKNPN